MNWLSENPWPLVGTLGALAAALLFALKVTQQAKYLFGAIAALLLAGGVLVLERVWVTNAERVERVVQALAEAVGRSDGRAALALLTPDVTYEQGGAVLGGLQAQVVGRLLPNLDEDLANPARAALKAAIENTTFDFVTITRLSASAGQQTRRGKAEFRAFAAGSIEAGGTRFNFATDANGSDWSLGFREVDGEWKIESIAAMRLPRGWRLPIGRTSAQ